MITVELICMLAGLVISLLVTVFKRISFVQKYPKVVAFILSLISGAISGLQYGNLDWSEIAACVIVPFMAAVTTYEVAIKPVQDNALN